jgi:hypothetical protein
MEKIDLCDVTSICRFRELFHALVFHKLLMSNIMRFLFSKTYLPHGKHKSIVRSHSIIKYCSASVRMQLADI